ncbi:uncharacterized protein HD556DRAFT_1526157 [Suillus plorans]|uniref:Uncharacterized protein n=1 Tax=Suillus plorans TaxID=116603 RepID=A0A9P7DKM9_9AGAM|nr:uncharacterized protein HD556DRAFT_1526157 [Suillus plorans]KAG1797119.1 hypothetical protein HD556DRAFT_1526157 [Suillus plorans]
MQPRLGPGPNHNTMPINIINPLVRIIVFVHCVGILLVIWATNFLGPGFSRARAVSVMIATWGLALTLSLIPTTRAEVQNWQGRRVGPVQILSGFFTFFWGTWFDPLSDESLAAGPFAGVSRYMVILLSYPIFILSIGYFADLNLQIHPLIRLEGGISVSTACYFLLVLLFIFLVAAFCQP